MLYNMFSHCKITKYNRQISIRNTKILAFLVYSRLNNVNDKSFLPFLELHDTSNQNDAYFLDLFFIGSKICPTHVNDTLI